MGAHETGNPRSAASFAVESLTDRLGDEVRFSAEEQLSQVGIEPTTRGLKVPCSATELLAQALLDSTSNRLHSPEYPPFPISCRVSLSASFPHPTSTPRDCNIVLLSFTFTVVCTFWRFHRARHRVHSAWMRLRKFTALTSRAVKVVVMSSLIRIAPPP